MVKVSLVTMEQGWATLATKQDVAVLKVEDWTRCFDVMSLRVEPAFVEKVGVTVNDIKLSDVCIADILLGYPCVPVSSEINA